MNKREASVPRAIQKHGNNAGWELIEHTTTRWSVRPPKVQENFEARLGSVLTTSELTNGYTQGKMDKQYMPMSISAMSTTHFMASRWSRPGAQAH